jgi:hypothetical protein
VFHLKRHLLLLPHVCVLQTYLFCPADTFCLPQTPCCAPSLSVLLIIQACNLLRFSFFFCVLQVHDSTLLEALARPLLAAAPTCPPQHLARALSAFTRLHHPGLGSDGTLFHHLLFTCLHRLRQFDAMSLVVAATAFSSLPAGLLPEEGKAQLFGAVAGRVLEPGMLAELGQAGRLEMRQALAGSGCTQLPRVAAALQVL